MHYIGCHLSASDGVLAMVKTACTIGADTFAFFTRNPRGSKAKQEDPSDAAAAMAAILFGEGMTSMQLLGGALILGGVLYYSRGGEA